MTFKKLAATTAIVFMCASGAALAQSASETAPSDVNVITQPLNETPEPSECDLEKGSAQACASLGQADPANDAEEIDIDTGAGMPTKDPANKLCDGEKGSSQACNDGNSSNAE